MIESGGNIISFGAEKQKREKENLEKMAGWCEENFSEVLYGGKEVSIDYFLEIFSSIKTQMPSPAENIRYCLSPDYKAEDIDKWIDGENIPEDENTRRNILQALLVALSHKIRREID